MGFLVYWFDLLVKFCCNLDYMKTYYSKMNKQDFEGIVDSKKVSLYILKNKNGVEISVSNFGGRVIEIFTPDRNGVFADIALGHNTLDKYVNYTAERFLGATIGRFGNRIAKGKFTLNGKEYTHVTLNGNTLEVSYNGYCCRYTVSGGEIIDLKSAARNRNGHYDTFAAEGKDTLTVQITIEKMGCR